MDMRRWHIRRGDTVIWELPVKLNGSPYNTAGCTFWLTVKNSFDDLDAAALSQVGTSTGDITPIGPTTDGLMQVKLPGTETQDYVVGTTLVYDVQVTTVTGDPFTLEVGEFEILPDVTRRTV